MAKFYGAIGFSVTTETTPGVWTPRMTVRNYYGDLIRNTSTQQPSGQVNDNLTVSNELSILADPYAEENFHQIKYAEFLGTKWKVTSVREQYPRLILTFGGVYND